MAQIAEIILAILGLCGVVSMPAVCWTIIGCEIFRIIVELWEKLNEL